MITRENIIEKLQELGYNAKPNDVTKNSVLMHAINIITENTNISPCIYVDELCERFADDLDKAVHTIINIYESHKSVNIDVDLFTNAEYILSHLFIGLQRESSEALVKRTCELEGIEQFLYIRMDSLDDTDGSASVKLNAHIMKAANLAIDDVWEAAKRNTFADNETVIKSMRDVLCEMLGNDDFVPAECDIPLYVITNKSQIRGSVQALDKEALKKWADSLPGKPSRLILIPSSINEMLISIPASDEDIDLERYNEMICEVNTNEVQEHEVLSNRAYIINL